MVSCCKIYCPFSGTVAEISFSCTAILSGLDFFSCRSTSEMLPGTLTGMRRLTATNSHMKYFHLAETLPLSGTASSFTSKIMTAAIIFSFRICKTNTSTVRYSSLSSSSLRKSLRSWISSELIFLP